MRKFIAKIVFFIIAFIPVTLILWGIAFFDNLDKNSSNNRNIISLQYKSKFDNLDILFIGNSYCYSGIKPSLLDSIGINSYNLGIATSGVEFYELILNDYLENISQKPKNVFVLVTPMTFSSKADNYLAYPIHRYLENPKLNIEIAIKYKHYKYFFSMFKKSLVKGLKNIFLSNGELSNNEITNKGYHGSKTIVTPSIIKETEHLYIPFLTEKFDTVKCLNFEKYFFNIKNKGIDVVYFELPTNKLNNYFSKDYLMSYNLFIDKLSRNNTVITIDKTKFTEEDYRNIDHMNDNGAEKTTREIITYLKK